MTRSGVRRQGTTPHAAERRDDDRGALEFKQVEQHTELHNGTPAQRSPAILGRVAETETRQMERDQTVAHAGALPAVLVISFAEVVFECPVGDSLAHVDASSVGKAEVDPQPDPGVDHIVTK